jgi:hypothetical protein
VYTERKFPLMNDLSERFYEFWRPALLLLVLAILSYVLFFRHIGQLVPGYATHEINTYHASSSLRTIADHPLNAPYKLVVWAAIKLGHHSILITRIAAATFGIVACLLFFLIVQTLYSYRVAFLATIMFATSGGLLHAARLGSPLILQMSLLALIGGVIWYRRSRQSLIGGYALVIALAILLYIPALIWFELLALVLLHKRILRVLGATAWPHIVAWVVLFAGLLTPLALAAVRTPLILRTLAGLPQHFASPLQILHGIANSILSIGVRSNGSPYLWVGHAPLLNIIELTLFALGAYALFKRAGRSLSIFLFVATIFSTVLIGLDGPINISSLVPLLYLFIAAGIYMLLSLWFTVFPRNPVARSLGVGLVCLLVVFSTLYQVRSYFVAWPNNAATKQVFNQKQPS